jgi:hypothetical protein
MDTLNLFLGAFAIFQGCFLLGMSIVTIFAYRKKDIIKHISTIATSYGIMTIIICDSLLFEAYPRTGVKGIAAMVAFGLGDYALLKILSQRAKKRKNVS